MRSSGRRLGVGDMPGCCPADYRPLRKQGTPPSDVRRTNATRASSPRSGVVLRSQRLMKPPPQTEGLDQALVSALGLCALIADARVELMHDWRLEEGGSLTCRRIWPSHCDSKYGRGGGLSMGCLSTEMWDER